MALDPISSIASLIETGINKFFPDKTEQEKGKFALLVQELSNTFQLALEQIKTNAVEAASKSVFVAGWRPFVGWVSGFGFAWQYVIGPLFYWVSALLGHPTPLPALDVGELSTLLLGMLGLGAMRSYDNKQKNGASGGH